MRLRLADRFFDSKPIRGAFLISALFALMATEDTSRRLEGIAFESDLTLEPGTSFVRNIEYTGAKSVSETATPFLAIRNNGSAGGRLRLEAVRISPGSKYTNDAGYDGCKSSAELDLADGGFGGSDGGLQSFSDPNELVLQVQIGDCEPWSRTGSATLTLENESDAAAVIHARGGAFYHSVGADEEKAAITAKVVP